MADRILTWHIPKQANLEALPRYYMEADYKALALRVYADTAPGTGDLEIDIQSAGVSIFNLQSSTTFTTQGQRTTTPTKTPVLIQGDNAETDAEDFTGVTLAGGSWTTLSITDLAGATGVSIQLELERLSESDEEVE